MADKQTALSIVIRTVDKATAGIHNINKVLDAATRPTRELGKAIGEFGEKSGFNAVAEGFKGVGEAVKETMFKVLEAGAIIGEVTHLVLELSEKFEQLGKTSDRLGVTVDFLAATRDSATRTGASVEQLDQGFQAFTENLGQARVGVGRMQKFLSTFSPALLKQLKATKSNEAAFRVLADAMKAVTDPAVRAALAQKTVGDAALAPVLRQGSKELKKQQDAYVELAGSQEEAVKAGTEVGESMKDLHAVTTGVEAAIVVGLAPALKIVVGKLTEWFRSHREDIAKWVDDIGKRIPDAVDKVVDSVKSAITWVGDFVRGIGGWKVAAIGMSAVITGPLISAITSLGIALTATPFGILLAGAAAIALLVKDLHDAGGPRSSKSFDAEEKAMASGAIPGGNEHAPSDLESRLMASGALPKSRRFRIEQGRAAAISREATANIEATRQADAEREKTNPAGPAMLKVMFENAPKGMRVTAAPSNTMNIDHTVGYSFGFAP